ncbi:hypothetical protein M408DRAFT_327310 [Serendipita vermifera MAFF 305830]|uniref:Autophagy-related protein 2 n=1 Tax=Serendipita vermifera MAFF 305830 TaxID=933852 RepID=A0A0C2X0W0_SERVB|nr:hypothetical protein M408DRAFT_327310 [Serendipita vermifera MAFF 305830]
MFSFIQLPFQLPSFSLPSLSVPASIQRRFIGFVLQKSLGHLVKPGQLDADKINAQLGSGDIEVNEVQLDEQAINRSLEGLPVRLKEGSLGRVAVNLPFPNILAAPLSMTVDRLELSLILQKPHTSRQTRRDEVDDPLMDPLAQSVASVAQEFIHEELETSSLRESLVLEGNNDGPGYPGGEDDDMATHVPGSLDPFSDNPLPSQARGIAERESEILEDVEGVSVLAQVVERLLARLSFKATNITIRIIHENRTEIILKLGSTSYITEEKQEQEGDANTLRISVGEKRTVRIDGIDLSILDLLAKRLNSVEASPISYNPPAVQEIPRDSPSPPPPPDAYEDNVDEDEEIDASMTESMLSLPPGPSLLRSESDSPTSTMYLSATSVRAHTPPPYVPDTLPPPVDDPPIGQTSHSTPPTIPTPLISEDPKTPVRTGSVPHVELQPTSILSFGKDALTITLTTPPPTTYSSNESAPAMSIPASKGTVSRGLTLSVTIGLITVALQTSHLDAILAMVSFIKTHESPNVQPPTRPPQGTKPNNTPTSALISSLHVTGTIRGIQAFIFRSNPLYPPMPAIIQDLFKHPSSSVVRAPHIHFHLEGLEAAYTPASESIKGRLGAVRGGIKDLSAFYISHSTTDDVWVASPLLIVDHLLPSQYDPHASFTGSPQSIPVVDWTDISSRPVPSGRPKRSLWRTKIHPQDAPKGTASKLNDDLEAVSLRLDISSNSLHVDIAPLHLFIDTAVISWLLELSKEITPIAETEGEIPDADWDDAVSGAIDSRRNDTSRRTEHGARQRRSPPTTPRAQTTALADLDDYDGQENKRRTAMMLADMEAEKDTLEEERGSHLRIVMIRCEVRHNSSDDPHLKQNKRSGALVLDLHEPYLLLCEPRADIPSPQGIGRARFAAVDDEENDRDLPLRLVFEWKHMLAFYAGPTDSKTTPFLHIGTAMSSPQSDMTATTPKEFRHSRVFLHSGEVERQAQKGAAGSNNPPKSATLVKISVPSIFTSLGKTTFDGLQFWADDLTRWAERAMSTSTTSIGNSQATSRAPSLLVGSRYFAGRTASSLGDDDSSKSAFEVKLDIDDVALHVQVPRQDGSVRPFSIFASDTKATVKIKPDGRDETVIMATVLDVKIQDTTPETTLTLLARSVAALLLDDRAAPQPEALQQKDVTKGIEHWMKLGYAPILHIVGIQVQIRQMSSVVPSRLMVDVSDAIVAVHLCADTIPTLAALAGDLASMAPATDTPPPKPSVSTIHNSGKRRDMSMSLVDNAFQRPPDIGPEPDMIEDDLPKNPDFIDASYGPGAGARPMTEEDLEDFEDDHFGGRSTPTQGTMEKAGVISSVGGETIRMMDEIKIIEGFYDTLQPDSNSSSEHSDANVSGRVQRSKLNLHLHSGYDWIRTRKMIEEEVKAIRRRLEKIRQLLAKGQTPDDSIEKTNTLLFNSVYLGLDADIDDMDEQGLMAAIDANLAEDYETASQESWQSLPIQAPLQKGETKRKRQKARTRSKRAEVEFEVQGLNLEFDKYGEGEALSSRLLATVQELKILDHMKTSSWDNFLTSMRTDSRGNRRETQSNMVRLELKMVRPVSTLPDEEARLRAKILPIRLHVDQDALDFLKQFFSFQDVNGYQPPVPPTPSPETFFQHVEIFPVELKLDYKPKRVDYKALKEGKTIELMNFFHFEDAAMTLRRITLTGLTGWARLGDTLNDLWTPDVKANQLADVISGGAVRAVVRAVPIAVIKPMIGASEAVRETLLGLRNTIDPGAIQENEDKYKGRG